MDLEKRIAAFVKLGNIFRDEKFTGENTLIKNASKQNGWFTEDNKRLAIASLGAMLEEKKIREWMGKYKNTKAQVKQPEPKKIGVIMAGNIPLVGFHDFLCVLISGNAFIGKLSSDDALLLPAVAKVLAELEPGFKDRIKFIDHTFKKNEGIDAFIATGSNNSARYFEYYFGKYPHIIRRNRNAVAVLDGTETETDLKNLGKDIFQYFGMGCRSVSKLYIPQEYKLDTFFEAIVDFGEVINHNKYANNHSYHRTIYLLNSEKFLDNNFLLVRENEQIASPVATLNYERYTRREDLAKKLEHQREQIQCVVGNPKSFLLNPKCIPFGQAQSPELWDYADGIDTMQFLLNL